MTDNQLSSVLDKLGAVKDTMTVSRVFGESYQVDGVIIVPVATVRGGGGGGGGEGKASGGEGTGTGAGFGFGVIVRPLGVYIVKDGEVSWQPAIDVLRVVIGGQLLALGAILALRRRSAVEGVLADVGAAFGAVAVCSIWCRHLLSVYSNNARPRCTKCAV